LLFFCLLVSSLISALPAQADDSVLENEAGFISIEPVDFYFHFGGYFPRLTLRSSEAKMFYSFHAADQDGEDKPLFVFFNGGPGSATSAGLMCMNTSHYGLDSTIEPGGGDDFLPNPYSWTRMGNLLYVDARQTGFSYNRMPGVGDYWSRFREFNAQNFNSLFDAADFIRLLFRFLASHPEIQGNRVIIVGESYGGVRAVAMMHLLHNYRDYANGVEIYQDPKLVDEIQAHYDAVFPEHAGSEVPPEVIARQFGHQILIQVAISYGYQRQVAPEMLLAEGGVIDQLELETGVPYDPLLHYHPNYYVRNVAGREVYIWSKPEGWLLEFFFNAGRLLRWVHNLALVTGVDVTSIDSFYASRRADAYRVYDPASQDKRAWVDSPVDDFLFRRMARLEAIRFAEEPGDMHLVFGALQPWDRYFIFLNEAANNGFFFWNVALMQGYDIDFHEPRYGRMFLKNVAHVETFVTNAAYDIAPYSPAIPPALERHTDILISASHELSLPQEEARPGQIVLHYHPGAFPDIPNLETRTIRFPFYDNSGHAVSLTQPEELLNDARDWLTQSGALAGEGGNHADSE
jgi:pimeloyl-ACP methyl ester carboxylesterase